MGISWDTPADSNRGSSLQSPTINTVGDDAHIVPAVQPIFTIAFGEFVGAQWGDVGIAPRIFEGCGEFNVTDLDFWEKSAILKLTRVLPANEQLP